MIYFVKIFLEFICIIIWKNLYSWYCSLTMLFMWTIIWINCNLSGGGRAVAAHYRDHLTHAEAAVPQSIGHVCPAALQRRYKYFSTWKYFESIFFGFLKTKLLRNVFLLTHENILKVFFLGFFREEGRQGCFGLKYFYLNILFPLLAESIYLNILLAFHQLNPELQI